MRKSLWPLASPCAPLQHSDSVGAVNQGTTPTKLISGLVLIVCVGAAPCVAQPTNLQARFSEGQTFLTWNEAPTATGYNVYRATTQITDVTGLSPIATVPQNSSQDLYCTVAGTTCLTQRFVIQTGDPQLQAGVGFFVYTTHVAGPAYYAVTTTTDTALAATNTAVQESVSAIQGAVRVTAPFTCPGTTWTCYPYMMWEDTATWDANWGYYGRRFDVAVATPIQAGQSYPLILDLHGAGIDGYQEPDAVVENSWQGIYVFPVDLQWSYSPDTYSGQYLQPGWFGYDVAATAGTPELAKSITEQRVVRYVGWVADARHGYQVDPQRIYVMGASMGGGGALHIGMHYPNLFAAVASSLTWIASGDWGDWFAFVNNPPVDRPTGPTFQNYLDGEWAAAQTAVRFPPVTYTFNFDDLTIPPGHFQYYLPTLETSKRGYAAVWQSGNHTAFWLDGPTMDGSEPWALTRFKLDEAYPAFANASNSVTFIDGTTAPGQRNQNLDWSSSLHSLGPGTDLVDSSTQLALTLKSLSANATATVTILNAHNFVRSPGTSVHWTNIGTGVNQSGMAQVDVNGLITITNVSITTGGVRLTITP